MRAECKCGCGLREHPGVEHIRLRRRGTMITLESGPENDPVRHARVRRVSATEWELEMPTHTGRWQPAFVRGRDTEVIRTLVRDFGWALIPIE